METEIRGAHVVDCSYVTLLTLDLWLSCVWTHFELAELQLMYECNGYWSRHNYHTGRPDHI